MTVVALVSAKGSPGVSTMCFALGAAWPGDRAVAVVECDPGGGDVAARFGLPLEPGLATLVLALRQASSRTTSFDHACQALPGGLQVLVAPVGADAASIVDRELALTGMGTDADGPDLVVDCGRLSPVAPGQNRMLTSADAALLVVRPDASGVAHGRWAAERLVELRKSAPGVPVSVLVNGEGPFSGEEVASAVGLPLAGSVPHDPGAAALIGGRPGHARQLARSQLMRSVGQLAVELSALGTDEELRDAC